MFLVVINQDAAIIDQHFKSISRHLDGQFNPFVYWHLARHFPERFPILPVTAQDKPSSRIQRDFVTSEFIGAETWLADFDEDSSVSAALFRQEHLHCQLSNGKGRLVTN